MKDKKENTSQNIQDNIKNKQLTLEEDSIIDLVGHKKNVLMIFD